MDPVLGLDSLGALDHPELRYYRPVLSWMAGDEDAACRGLEALAMPRARALLALIRRQRIPVLAQIPRTGGGSFRLLDGIEHDPKFDVLAVGDPGGVQLRPYEPVATHVGDGSAFAFFVCAMIESQHPPVDLVRLACPTIGYTSDFDAQLLSVAPWLKAFDHVMVCDQQVEWRDVRAIKGASVHAFPVVFSAPPEVPALRDGGRDIDVFFSGTVFSSYQPDKAEIVHQLLRIPGLRVVMLDGHVSYEEYYAFLSRAKITQNFCRHPGAMLTRALESLSMGSIALVQEGSVHQLWGGPETGVFTFQAGRLGDAVVRILADYERHRRACHAHAERIRRLFAPEAVASRFFRYAAVLATGAPRTRDTALDGALPQRRHVFLVGQRPALADAARQCKDNLAFGYPGHRPAERLNLRARERALLHCQALHEGQTPPSGPLAIEEAIADLRRATQLDPDALIVRFNLIRLLMHLSDISGLAEALELAEETVRSVRTRWRIDPYDDAYPWDFFGEWFDSRSYLDTASEAMGGVDRSARLVQLVYASLHHYIAVQRRSAQHARQAVSLNVEFPYYALRLAQLLALSGSPDDAREAARLLVGLTTNSGIAGRALRELEALADQQGDHRASLGPAAAFEAAHGAIIGLHHGLGHLRSEYVHRTLLREQGFGAAVHQAGAEGPRPRLTVLICGQAARGCRTLLKALADQSAPDDSYEVIYVECFEYLPAEASLADVAISCAQNGFWEHRLEALARAFEHARGEVVLVIEPGSKVDHRFVERLLASYCVTPDALITQCITIGGWLEDQTECRYVAFPATPARMVGGFDLHTAFAGRNGTPLELAFRLQQFGLPAVVESGGVQRYRRLPPWWHLHPFSSGDAALSACALLFPRLLDEHRVDALISWRQVHAEDPADDTRSIEETSFGFNILRYQGQYIGLRQSLGAVDFREGVMSLAKRFGSANAVVAEDLDTVRRAIIARAALTPPSRSPEDGGPRVVETLRDFNIVRVRGLYVGLRQAIGAVDFNADYDVHELLNVFGEDNVVLSDSLGGARSQILVLDQAISRSRTL